MDEGKLVTPKFKKGERVEVTGLPKECGAILDSTDPSKDRAFIGMWGTVSTVFGPYPGTNNEHRYSVQLDSNNVRNGERLWPESSLKLLDIPSEAERIRNEFLKLIGAKE